MEWTTVPCHSRRQGGRQVYVLPFGTAEGPRPSRCVHPQVSKVCFWSFFSNGSWHDGPHTVTVPAAGQILRLERRYSTCSSRPRSALGCMKINYFHMPRSWRHWKGENSSGEAALFLLQQQSPSHLQRLEDLNSFWQTTTHLSSNLIPNFHNFLRPSRQRPIDHKPLASASLELQRSCYFSSRGAEPSVHDRRDDLSGSSLVANSLQRTSAIMNTVVQGLGSHGVTVTSGSSKSFEYIGYNLSYNKRGWCMESGFLPGPV